jgi:hypothetical protein
MPDFLVCGSLTRDRIELGPRRWTQAGGAPWHGGLALAALALPDSVGAMPGLGLGEGLRVAVMAQAGPWVRRMAVPGLATFGVRWLGPATDSDTVFTNRYGAVRRQRLRATARRLEASDVPSGRWEAAIVSPLHRDDVSAEVVRALRERGAFVALDAQGLLRTVGEDGWLETATLRGDAMLADAHVVKFSVREFEAFAGPGDRRRRARAVAREFNTELLVTRGADGVLLASGDAVVEIPVGAEVVGRDAGVDVTGAGDVLLATYVAARLAGHGPTEAVEVAALGTGALLRRRPGGDEGAALIREFRRLYACALVLGRLANGGLDDGAGGDLFGRRSALVRAVNAHLPLPVFEAEVGGGAAERAAGLLSGCWALLSVGWPGDAKLSVAAVRAALDGELAGVRALHGG